MNSLEYRWNKSISYFLVIFQTVTTQFFNLDCVLVVKTCNLVHNYSADFQYFPFWYTAELHCTKLQAIRVCKECSLVHYCFAATEISCQNIDLTPLYIIHMVALLWFVELDRMFGGLAYKKDSKKKFVALFKRRTTQLQ